MNLPASLRQAIDDALNGVADVAARAAALSARYRDQRREGVVAIADRRDALVYAAVRLPATYAALRASFAAIAAARPDFVPASALDIGAGPGTALWAIADCWPATADVLLVEASPALRALGEALADGADLPLATWRTANILAVADELARAPRDLVCMSYALNEIPPPARPDLVARLWRASADTLLIVEPGTPAGFARIRAARAQLIAGGGHVTAPCPHAQDCPLSAPDWCHFARRLARSRRHLQAKGAAVPFEDEKFSYVAVSRHGVSAAAARVIARPHRGSGHVTLKLCRADATVGETTISRRDGARFSQARRAEWGSAV